MRYSFISAAILAISSSVAATDATAFFDSVSIPTNLQAVPVGSVLDITWDPTTTESVNTESVTINLLQGATQQTLQFAASPVASAVKNSLGTYAWTVPSSVFGYALYGFQIVDASNASLFQYSYPFTITDADATTSSSYTGSVLATTTVQLVANTAYTGASTAVTTVAALTNATSVYIPSNSTRTASSNLTTTLSTAKSTTAVTTIGTKTTATSSSGTSVPPSKVSSGATVGNFANGGLAMVGAAFIALVL